MKKMTRRRRRSSPNSRRPNAHGGLHTRARSSTLQPLSNGSQKLSSHIRASPFGVIYTEDTRFGEKCGRGCDSDDNEEGHCRHVYKIVMGLFQALTKGDANAVEKASDLGNDTKACGSESNSDTDVDEDSEGNESASKTEVLPPVDKKASRKENKKGSKRRKGSEEKQSLQGCEERKEKLAKAYKTG